MIEKLTSKPSRKMNVGFNNPNVIYVTVPKSANTTIKHRLAFLYTGKSLSGIDIHRRMPGQEVTKKFILDNKNNYTVFSFVRNPWARVVSMYTDKINFRTGTPGQIGILRKHPAMSVKMSFDDFVRALSKINLNVPKVDLHIRTQSFFLYKDDQFLPDFLGKVETMNEDWEKLCELTGFKYDPLPRKNESKVKKIQWKEYYTEKTKDLISKIYKQDIENFNYTFEDI